MTVARGLVTRMVRGDSPGNLVVGREAAPYDVRSPVDAVLYSLLLRLANLHLTSGNA